MLASQKLQGPLTPTTQILPKFYSLEQGIRKPKATWSGTLNLRLILPSKYHPNLEMPQADKAQGKVQCKVLRRQTL